MTILVGVREEELTQKLVFLESNCTLDDMVNVCRSYEAAKRTTTAIRAQPEVRAMSTYLKNKGKASTNPLTPHLPGAQRQQFVIVVQVNTHLNNSILPPSTHVLTVVVKDTRHTRRKILQ
ncbi:hypothetical protein Pcinc_000652 [Petrolisthes cinctipes]|uniref:Uncharacterized protein n=1 Tax=Petrolisthes cinctipes TaxID=88211 RepID=A0AAE1GPT2_PETCI|nr:hypothetical protein Pcinc_000652 [Petrolisthes cinctipes]